MNDLLYGLAKIVGKIIFFFLLLYTVRIIFTQVSQIEVKNFFETRCGEVRTSPQNDKFSHKLFS